MSRLIAVTTLVTILSGLSVPAFAEVSSKIDVTGSLSGQRVMARARPMTSVPPVAAVDPAPKRCSGARCIRMFGSLGVGY